MTPAAWGVPNASERGAQSKVSHKWAAGYITLAARAVPTASSGLQNQRWATSGPGGYITSTT